MPSVIPLKRHLNSILKTLSLQSGCNTLLIIYKNNKVILLFCIHYLGTRSRFYARIILIRRVNICYLRFESLTLFGRHANFANFHRLIGSGTSAVAHTSCQLNCHLSDSCHWLSFRNCIGIETKHESTNSVECTINYKFMP